MEPIVVDSNAFVAYLVESEEFHQRSRIFINGLESGDYEFHLPMLVVVEIAAALNRRLQRNRTAILSGWHKTISNWEKSGKVVLYSLDRGRMDKAVNIARSHRLRGADSVIAALAEELGIPLKTFDTEILARFQQASV